MAMTIPLRVWVRRSLRACLPRLSQNNLDLISERCPRGVQHIAGQLDYGRGLHAYRSDSPGFQILFQVNHSLLLIQVEHIDRETHGKGVNSPRGNNPQTLSCMKAVGFGAHQAAKAKPLVCAEEQWVGEIGLPGPIKTIAHRPL